MMTSRMLNHSRSRAILIKTTASQDSGIPPTPGAAASVAGMQAVLTSPELCGWSASSVVIPVETSNASHVGMTLRQLARKATEVLLVYFVGHGMFGRDEHFYLSLAGTDSQDPENSSLAYEQIRREVLNSRARLKIVILDCPFSGRVIETMPENPLAMATRIFGAYVLTSTDYSVPLDPVAPGSQATLTPFTAELIGVFRSGIPGGPAELTLDDLYASLRRRLGQRGQPQPNLQVSARAQPLALTRNAAYEVGREPASPSRRRLMVAGGAVAVLGAAVAVTDLPGRSGSRQPRRRARAFAWRGHALDGPAGPVYGLAFSPDGSRLAAGSADGNAWLWEVRQPGAPARHLRQGSIVYGVAFSRDGSLLATGSADGLVQLWDLGTGRAQRIVRHSSTVWQVAFSTDAATLASSSSDRTAILSPLGSPGRRAVLRHPRTVFSVAFDLAGKTLATGCNDAAVRLWDLSTQRLSGVLSGHHAAITQMTFQPHHDRTLATGSWDRTVRFWDVPTRRSFASLTGFGGTVSGVAFSPDGRNLATGCADTTVSLWDVATRHRTSTRHDPVDVFGVAFSPDGTLLATTSHQIVWLWDI